MGVRRREKINFQISTRRLKLKNLWVLRAKKETGPLCSFPFFFALLRPRFPCLMAAGQSSQNVATVVGQSAPGDRTGDRLEAASMLVVERVSMIEANPQMGEQDEEGAQETKDDAEPGNVPIAGPWRSWGPVNYPRRTDFKVTIPTQPARPKEGGNRGFRQDHRKLVQPGEHDQRVVGPQHGPGTGQGITHRTPAVRIVRHGRLGAQPLSHGTFHGAACPTGASRTTGVGITGEDLLSWALDGCSDRVVEAQMITRALEASLAQQGGISPAEKGGGDGKVDRTPMPPQPRRAGMFAVTCAPRAVQHILSHIGFKDRSRVALALSTRRTAKHISEQILNSFFLGGREEFIVLSHSLTISCGPHDYRVGRFHKNLPERFTRFLGKHRDIISAGSFVLMSPRFESRRGDGDFVEQIVRRNGDALKLAPSNLKKRREIVVAAVEHDGRALEHADPKWQSDPEVALIAVKKHWCALSFVDPDLARKGGEIETTACAGALRAVAREGMAPQHRCSACAKMWGNRNFVMIALEHDGCLLQHADAALQDDLECVMTAVRQNCFSLEFASATLKATQSVVDAALQQAALQQLDYVSRLHSTWRISQYARGAAALDRRDRRRFLTQPVPPNAGMIRCTIERRGGRFPTYHLYLSHEQAGVVQGGRGEFLLAAKSTRKLRMRHQISMDPNLADRDSDMAILLGSDKSQSFELFKAAGGDERVSDDTTSAAAGGKPEDERSEYAAIDYYDGAVRNNDQGGPRIESTMGVSLPVTAYRIGGFPNALYRPSHPSSAVLTRFPDSAGHRGPLLQPDGLHLIKEIACTGNGVLQRSRRSGVRSLLQDRATVPVSGLRHFRTGKGKYLRLDTKPRVWNNHTRALDDDANGRAKLSSPRNFQLIFPQVETYDPPTPILQLGLQTFTYVRPQSLFSPTNQVFIMDFQHPLSVLSAFGICLSRFRMALDDKEYPPPARL